MPKKPPIDPPTMKRAAIFHSTKPEIEVVHRCRQTESADRQQRRTDGVEDRHAGAEHDAGYDQETAADAEKSRKRSDDEPDHDKSNGDAGCYLNTGIARRGARPQHRYADRDHRQREQE